MHFIASLAPLAALACRAAAGLVPRDTTAQAHAMMAVPLDIGTIDPAEFNNFYENDHFVRIFKLPGFLSNSRFDAIDGQEPEQTTLYDLATIEAIHSPEWQYFDTHRPQNEIDIISRCNSSDLLNYVLLGDPVGSIHGPSVMAFIEYTPATGKEAEVDASFNKNLIPYLKGIKGFQRARKYTLDSYRYFFYTDRPAPPTNVVVIEYEINSGAFNTTTFKQLQKGILESKSLKAVNIRLWKTRGTFGNFPYA